MMVFICNFLLLVLVPSFMGGGTFVEVVLRLMQNKASLLSCEQKEKSSCHRLCQLIQILRVGTGRFYTSPNIYLQKSSVHQCTISECALVLRVQCDSE